MRNIGVFVFALLTVSTLGSSTFAASRKCKSVSKYNADHKMQKVEICFTQGRFSHDIYVLSLNGAKVFEKIDDEVMKFEATSNGKWVTGGCKPNLKTQELGDMPVEVSRTCRVAVDHKEVGVIKFDFD